MELLLELLIQLVAELILGPTIELIGELLPRPARSTRPSVFIFGLFMLVLSGVSIALLISFFFEARLLPASLPGLSLALTPLALGTVMHFFGRWRAANGHRPTVLATFAGGAALGLGLASGRLAAVVL